jgi:cell wall-associated NlpC family hydrolase
MKKIQITLIALLIGVYQTTVAADFNLPWSNDKVNGEKSQSIEATVSEPASWSNYAQDVILSALSLMGVKYSWGGKTPEGGLDCSGFVRFVFQQATNLTLPHGARALSQLGTNVSNNDLQPGDLVFFNTLKSSFSHVGIYIGNNRFIHAPRTGREVVITDMTESYWAKRFNGARRIDPRDLASFEANPNTQIK